MKVINNVDAFGKLSGSLINVAFLNFHYICIIYIFRSNHLGGISRIDVDSRTGNLAYGIPPDNPFLSDPTAVPELYAYGFRQPYHTSMDRGDKITGEA